MAKILIIDDEKAVRRVLEIHLKREGHEIVTGRNGKEGLDILSHDNFDLVITDLQMPKLTGIEFLEELKKKNISVPIIVLTVVDNVEKAVEAIRLGASDYLLKPPQLEEISHRVDTILSQQSLIEENKRLKKALVGNFKLGNIIGKSVVMERVFEKLKPLSADGDISILLFGESGTGKELVANAIHYNSPRAEKPFVAINCAALPEHLLESELFGHEKGAFTGAENLKKGLFEVANGGTIFLDEISSMPLGVQAKLLRAIEERSIRRVGGTNTIDLNIRFVAAANQDLEILVKKTKFRQDLYYRLAVAAVELPPLRDRNGDIRLLAQFFLEKFCKEKGKKIDINGEVFTSMESYQWKGNVRELENLLELLVVTAGSNHISISDLPSRYVAQNIPVSASTDTDSPEFDLKKASKQIIREFETKAILHELEKHRGNVSKTAEKLSISRVALHSKMKEYAIENDK